MFAFCHKQMITLSDKGINDIVNLIVFNAIRW